MSNFSELLCQFRKRAGMTQGILANKIHKHRNTISAYEAGQFLPKHRDHVLELANALFLSEEETDQLLISANYPARNFIPQSKEPGLSSGKAKDTFSFFQWRPSLFPSHAHGQSVYHSSHFLPNESPLPTSSIFLFNEPLTDPHAFYARDLEREILLHRTYRKASTSIIGPRKIGKTWLVHYLLLVAPTELGAHFRFAYLDATAPSCRTIAGFTLAVINELGFPLSQATQGLSELEKVIRELKTKNVVPVCCIDEFEGLSNRDEFTIDFFRGLRAMTQKYHLVLVVVSKDPLIEIVGKEVETSGFFNVFEQITMRPFDVEEARTFIEEKCMHAEFTKQDCQYLWKYGQEGEQQWPPLRLQLVGKMLLEDKIHHYYLPHDQNYWKKFEQRLEEKYRGVHMK
jgi:DNA-binding XRE family transcriptional regulator